MGKINLILVHSSISPQKIKQSYSGTQWIYFGRSYLVMKKFEDALTNELKINYKKELTRVSYSLRDVFVGWSAEIGRSHWGKWEWWITRLATRSTQISPLFLYLCYLEVIKPILESRKEPLIVISESWELLEVLQNHYDGRVTIADDFRTEQSLRKIHDDFNSFVWFIAAWGKFFLICSYEWFASRLTGVGCPPKQDHVYSDNHSVIHTCIDDACIHEDGKFSDRYYPELAEYLREKGKKVSTLICLSNVRNKSRFHTFRWFRNNKESFLIPQDYYNLVDCFKSFSAIMKSSRLIGNDSTIFNSVDVAALIRKEQQLQRQNTGAAYFINQIPMFRKWKQLGYKLEYYIDFWELKFCEVPALISIKENYPSCKRISYQHGASLPKLLLSNYKTTPDEFNHAPHADIGIANSILNFKFLKKEGFPNEYVVLGPALRFFYLKNQVTVSIENTSSKPIILVIVPLLMSSAVELLEKCIQAFPENNENYALMIKIHPMMPLAKLKRNMSLAWPSHFGIADGTFEEWLNKSKCLIVSDSSAMVESVYRNIYTIIYRKETDIDLIPLDIDDNIRGWIGVSTPDELKKEVLKSLTYKMNKDSNHNNFFEFSIDKLESVFT